MAADAVELRAITAGVARVLRVGRHTHRLEPLHASAHDVRDARQSLDVIDDGRLAKGPFNSGKRRLNSRPSTFSFQAFDQAGLLAADVGAGAAMEEDIEMKVLAEDVSAEQSGAVGFIDRFLHRPKRTAVFIPQVEIRRARPRRVAAEDDP